MDKKLSRRGFFKASSMLALAGGSSLLFADNHSQHKANQATHSPSQNEALNTARAYQARIFLSNNNELAILAEACERIFPKDELGAGAKELGAHFFIDKELAGNYGSCAKDYRQPPFIQGKKNQGYQYALTRAQLFKLGIKALDDEAQARFKKAFIDTTEAQKDEILKAFESNKTQISFIENVQTSDFFAELRAMTLAGVYSDPIYGGNKNMQGWRMKRFPGAQMTYFTQVSEGDKFEIIEPISLADMSH